jgi:hypothetical protein
VKLVILANTNGVGPGNGDEVKVTQAKQAKAPMTLNEALGYLYNALLRSDRNVRTIRRLTASLRRTACPPGSTPRLVELCKLARERRGRGSEMIEQAAWVTLVRLAELEALPFVAETLRLTPQRDRFVNRRRRLALATLVEIQEKHRDSHSLEVLDAALTSSSPIIRAVAPQLLSEIYLETGYAMPRAVIDRLVDRMENDSLPQVQFAAARALFAHGLVDEDTVWDLIMCWEDSSERE